MSAELEPAPPAPLIASLATLTAGVLTAPLSAATPSTDVKLATLQAQEMIADAHRLAAGNANVLLVDALTILAVWRTKPALPASAVAHAAAAVTTADGRDVRAWTDALAAAVAAGDAATVTVTVTAATAAAGLLAVAVSAHLDAAAGDLLSTHDALAAFAAQGDASPAGFATCVGHALAAVETAGAAAPPRQPVDDLVAALVAATEERLRLHQQQQSHATQQPPAPHGGSSSSAAATAASAASTLALLRWQHQAALVLRTARRLQVARAYGLATEAAAALAALDVSAVRDASLVGGLALQRALNDARAAAERWKAAGTTRFYRFVAAMQAMRGSYSRRDGASDLSCLMETDAVAGGDGGAALGGARRVGVAMWCLLDQRWMGQQLRLYDPDYTPDAGDAAAAGTGAGAGAATGAATLLRPTASLPPTAPVSPPPRVGRQAGAPSQAQLPAGAAGRDEDDGDDDDDEEFSQALGSGGPVGATAAATAAAASSSARAGTIRGGTAASSVGLVPRAAAVMLPVETQIPLVEAPAAAATLRPPPSPGRTQVPHEGLHHLQEEEHPKQHQQPPPQEAVAAAYFGQAAETQVPDEFDGVAGDGGGGGGGGGRSPQHSPLSHGLASQEQYTPFVGGGSAVPSPARAPAAAAAAGGAADAATIDPAAVPIRDDDAGEKEGGDDAGLGTDSSRLSHDADALNDAFAHDAEGGDGGDAAAAVGLQSAVTPQVGGRGAAGATAPTPVGSARRAIGFSGASGGGRSVQGGGGTSAARAAAVSSSPSAAAAPSAAAPTSRGRVEPAEAAAAAGSGGSDDDRDYRSTSNGDDGGGGYPSLDLPPVPSSSSEDEGDGAAAPVAAAARPRTAPPPQPAGAAPVGQKRPRQPPPPPAPRPRFVRNEYGSLMPASADDGSGSGGEDEGDGAGAGGEPAGAGAAADGYYCPPAVTPGGTAFARIIRPGSSSSSSSSSSSARAAGAARAAPTGAASSSSSAAAAATAVSLEEARARLAKCTVDQLAALLELNGMKKSGKSKRELGERALEAVRHGCLPRCPRCRQGFLRPRADDPALLECPGWYDESRGRSGGQADCGYTIEGREPGVRPPWRWR